jgi:hypothetical protein
MRRYIAQQEVMNPNQFMKVFIAHILEIAQELIDFGILIIQPVL